MINTIIPRFIFRGFKYALKFKNWYGINSERWSKYGLIDCGCFSLCFKKENKRERRYGLFGDSVAHYDKNGFTEILVIIQDSGLYAGAAPLELSISNVVPFNDLNFGRQYVAKLNRKADLPFRLFKAKVKIIDCGELIKDEDLIKYNLLPLKDKLE